MNTVSLFVSEKFKLLQQYLKSTSFSKAALIGIAITVPIIVGIVMDKLDIGLAICFGAFWCSPSDVSGNLKHKQIGIAFSTLLIVFVSFIGGHLQVSNYILFPFYLRG